MRKKRTFKKLTTLIRNSKSIFPFTQHPPIEKEETSKNSRSIDASELFSYFTADIIKEKVLFTR